MASNYNLGAKPNGLRPTASAQCPTDAYPLPLSPYRLVSQLADIAACVRLRNALDLPYRLPFWAYRLTPRLVDVVPPTDLPTSPFSAYRVSPQLVDFTYYPTYSLRSPLYPPIAHGRYRTRARGLPEER